MFRGFNEDICFFGHSHIPSIFAVDDTDGLYLMAPMGDEETIALKPATRYLINCGSVGQPRDYDPRASYTIYDTAARTFEFKRVAYDIDSAAQKIFAADLERNFGNRLFLGV